WTKTGVSPKAEVFGDNNHVYVFESGGDGVPAMTRALRAEDGVSVPIPDFSALYPKRIRTLGRLLLLSEDDAGGGKICRLYDVHTGRDVWRHAFSAGAIVMRSEEPGLTGVIEKDHTVTLLEAHSGAVLFRSLIQAEHADKLQSAALLGDQDRLYLALSREKESGLDWNANLTNGLCSLKIHGPLYALNRSS